MFDDDGNINVEAVEAAADRIATQLAKRQEPSPVDMMLLAVGAAFRKGEEMGYHYVEGLDLELMADSFARGLRSGRAQYQQSREGADHDNR